MNCNRALEMLLDAEPAELTLDAATPLVSHLESCGRCAVVADRLRAQAAALATVAARRPSVVGLRPRWAPVTARALWGTAFVGAAAVLVVWTLPERTTPLSVGTGVPDRPVVTSREAGAALAGVAGTPSLDRARSPLLTVTPGIPFAAQRIEAVAYEAQVFESTAGTQSDDAANPTVRGGVGARNVGAVGVVSVAPPEGTRATIMQTGDPNVTVVWLQPADTTRSPR